MRVCTNACIEQGKFMKENSVQSRSCYMLRNRKTDHYDVENLVTFSYTPLIWAKSKLLRDYL